MKYIYLLTSFLTVTLLVSSCKKKDATDIITDPVVPGCYITKMTFAGKSVTLTYRNNGRVDSTYEFGGNFPVERKFDWHDGYVVVRETTNGIPFGHDSITFNSEGYVTSMRDYFNQDQNYYQTDYRYNGSNEVQGSTLSVPNGMTYETAYTFSGGNLSSKTANGYVSTALFNTSLNAMTGDYFSYNSLRTYGGLKIFNNKNLFTGYQSGGV